MSNNRKIYKFNNLQNLQNLLEGGVYCDVVNLFQRHYRFFQILGNSVGNLRLFDQDDSMGCGDAVMFIKHLLTESANSIEKQNITTEIKIGRAHV